MEFRFSLSTGAFPWKLPVLEEKEAAGHQKALRLLKQKSASVLIWGKILTLRGKASPRLYWTALHEDQCKPFYSTMPLPEEQFRLPEVFWSDLSQILELLVAVGYTEFMRQRGHYIADLLPPFIGRVRTLLQASSDSPKWNKNSRDYTCVVLADALRAFGGQKGESSSLMEAMTMYRQVLYDMSTDLSPLRRAAIREQFRIRPCDARRAGARR